MITMRYFKPELIEAANDWVEQSGAELADAEARMEVVSKQYWQDLEGLQSRVSRDAWKFFRYGFGSEGLHDARLLSLRAGDGLGFVADGAQPLLINRQRTSVVIEFLNYEQDRHYVFDLRHVNRLSCDLFGDPERYVKSIGDLYITSVPIPPLTRSPVMQPVMRLTRPTFRTMPVLGFSTPRSRQTSILPTGLMLSDRAPKPTRFIRKAPAIRPSGIADLRSRTSTLVVVSGINDAATCLASNGVATTPCTINVQGTTLEQPPTQANSGGFNSTWSSGTVTLGTPLANGASVNIRVLFGIQQTGSFKFYVNIEALP